MKNELNSDQSQSYHMFKPDASGLWISTFFGVRYKIYSEMGIASVEHFKSIWPYISESEKYWAVLKRGLHAAIGYKGLLTVTSLQPMQMNPGECVAFFLIDGQTELVVNRAIFINFSLSCLEFEFN